MKTGRLFGDTDGDEHSLQASAGSLLATLLIWNSDLVKTLKSGSMPNALIVSGSIPILRGSVGKFQKTFYLRIGQELKLLVGVVEVDGGLSHAGAYRDGETQGLVCVDPIRRWLA